MDNKNDISCEVARDSLLAQVGKELDDHIKRHLKSCERCREFQMLLKEVSLSSEIGVEAELQPDPRTLQLLKERFEAQNATFTTKWKRNAFEPLLALFQKRIPVYQVMLAVFIAGIFYFSYSRLDFSGTDLDDLTSGIESTSQAVEFPVQQLNQNQQIGKSMAEDSLLAKFRVSIL